MVSRAWSTGDLDKGLEAILLGGSEELPDSLEGLQETTNLVRYAPHSLYADDFQPYVLLWLYHVEKNVFT